jgi:hypothetical protein
MGAGYRPGSQSSQRGIGRSDVKLIVLSKAKMLPLSRCYTEVCMEAVDNKQGGGDAISLQVVIANRNPKPYLPGWEKQLQ